jgi:hypothetical protein
MNGDKQPIPILLFAESILGIKILYDWQAQILLNYEAGHQTATMKWRISFRLRKQPRISCLLLYPNTDRKRFHRLKDGP